MVEIGDVKARRLRCVVRRILSEDETLLGVEDAVRHRERHLRRDGISAHRLVAPVAEEQPVSGDDEGRIQNRPVEFRRKTFRVVSRAGVDISVRFQQRVRRVNAQCSAGVLHYPGVLRT